MPSKLMYQDGLVVQQEVTREEYLQATIYLFEEYSSVDNSMALPLVAPSTFETGLLYLLFLNKREVAKEE